MEWENKFWSLGNNQLAKELLGIDKFHKAGYRGKRVNVGNMEPCNVNHEIFRGKVIDTLGDMNTNDLNGNWHGDKTVIIQHMVAPESTIYMISRKRNGIKYDTFREHSYDLIKNKNISIVTTSQNSNPEGREELYNDLFENYNFKMCTSSGNSRWNNLSVASPKNSFKISGSNLSSRKREFYAATYATKGRPYRVMNSYVPMYTPSISINSKTSVHFEEGTSFSTPFFAGMLALVDDFFIDKVGRPLNYKEMTKFILDNAVPTDIVYDEQNYIFVLPDPKDIKVSDYIQDEIKQPDKPNSSDKEVIRVDEFKDVDPTRYSAESIYKMVEKGLLKGYKDNTFKPKEPISREDFAVVLDRLIEKYL